MIDNMDGLNPTPDTGCNPNVMRANVVYLLFEDYGSINATINDPFYAIHGLKDHIKDHASDDMKESAINAVHDDYYIGSYSYDPYEIAEKMDIVDDLFNDIIDDEDIEVSDRLGDIVTSEYGDNEIYLMTGLSIDNPDGIDYIDMFPNYEFLDDGTVDFTVKAANSDNRYRITGNVENNDLMAEYIPPHVYRIYAIGFNEDHKPTIYHTFEYANQHRYDSGCSDLFHAGYERVINVYHDDKITVRTVLKGDN